MIIYEYFPDLLIGWNVTFSAFYEQQLLSETRKILSFNNSMIFIAEKHAFQLVDIIEK